MNNKVLIVIALVLILLGLSRHSSVNFPVVNPSPETATETLKIEAPQDEELKGLAEGVRDSLKNGDSDRSKDGMRLASLYNDMSILISIDDDIIKNTGAIAEANVLSAKLLQIDLKGKYPGLSEAAEKLFKTYVSDKAVALDDTLRDKAVKAFQALAWGCLEGAK